MEKLEKEFFLSLSKWDDAMTQAWHSAQAWHGCEAGWSTKVGEPPSALPVSGNEELEENSGNGVAISWLWFEYFGVKESFNFWFWK